MVSLTELWLPILLSAVLVFVASSIVHMVLPYHRTDFRAVPKQDEVMDSLRRFAIPPGDYMMPKPDNPAALRDAAFIDKMNKGPVAVMTVMRNGPWAMGGQLVQWFVFCLVVSLFAGYLASRALPPGSEYLKVSQVASTTAFAAYALGQWPLSIWYKRAVSTTLKGTLDGLIYGFVTGGVFGWLWPH
jgi:hypothetical protein